MINLDNTTVIFYFFAVIKVSRYCNHNWNCRKSNYVVRDNKIFDASPFQISIVWCFNLNDFMRQQISIAKLYFVVLSTFIGVSRNRQVNDLPIWMLHKNKIFLNVGLKSSIRQES